MKLTHDWFTPPPIISAASSVPLGWKLKGRTKSGSLPLSYAREDNDFDTYCLGVATSNYEI